MNLNSPVVQNALSSCTYYIIIYEITAELTKTVIKGFILVYIKPNLNCSYANTTSKYCPQDTFAAVFKFWFAVSLHKHIGLDLPCSITSQWSFELCNAIYMC